VDAFLRRHSQPLSEPTEVALAGFSQPIPDALPSPETSGEELETPTPHMAPSLLTLAEVVQSVETNYPLLAVALREYDIAAGKALAAFGQFDLSVQAYGIAQPLGFYENYRNGITLTQPTWRGGYLYSGYRIGDGDFPVWYGERETDEGGEFKVGLAAQLLQGRAIDKRRSEVWQTALARDAVAPNVQSQRLEFVRLAAQTYWTWVGAGLVLQLQRELLQLAEDRVMQIDERIRVGDLERVADITNRQLIATREAKVIEAERKLQAAAIKLSLFLRTPDGTPVVPEPDRLLGEFPSPAPPDETLLSRDIDLALAVRPELQELEVLRQQAGVELAQAENQLLPKIEARLETSKDVGARASAKGDKTPLELEAGLYGEVPLQRREAQGKVRAAQGKLAQLTAKQQYAADKIVAEVRDAHSALAAAAERIERAATYLDLARQSLEFGRASFEAGDIDVVVLNLYEQAVADAQLTLIAAQADFFYALADYRAALALTANTSPARERLNEAIE
jgi:outer membrane protein TolC